MVAKIMPVLRAGYCLVLVMWAFTHLTEEPHALLVLLAHTSPHLATTLAVRAMPTAVSGRRPSHLVCVQLVTLLRMAVSHALFAVPGHTRPLPVTALALSPMRMVVQARLQLLRGHARQATFRQEVTECHVQFALQVPLRPLATKNLAHLVLPESIARQASQVALRAM